MSRRKFSPAIAIAGVLALFLLSSAATDFFANLWWFREIGYQVVFTREIITRALLFVVVGTAVGTIARVNLAVAQRGVIPEPVTVMLGGEGMPALDLTQGARRLTGPVSIGFGLVFGLTAMAAWDTVLQFIHRTPFGVTDPIFARDIGYYVFTQPALATLLAVLSSVVALLLLVLVPVYFARGDIVVRPQSLRVEPRAGLHFAILLAAWFLIGAVRLWFIDSAGLLFSTTGPLVGASYTDLHATLPALRVSALAAVLAAGAVLVGAIRGKAAWYAAVSVAGYIVVAVAGRALLPAAMQKFVVAPTELTRESPYLAHHISATRRAWGIDSVQSRDLGGEADLTLADVRANTATIENVRLWDREPLLRTFGQLQEIRTYYDFVAVDDDRYWIDGKYRQVLLSPRELNPASLPTRTFINEHLTFTHGMGLTMSPVNQVTPEGLPVLFVKDLPPATTGSLRVTRPQIYYGEITEQYAFVNTRQREFDYPAGETNVYSAYSGSGGVPVGNVVRRLLLAAHFGSSKILLSGDITSESRVLYHRNISRRVAKALPFLRLDRDPYIVITAEGTLQWIQDAYTVTDRYPYSFRAADGSTYMRNAVKVVVDAYDGTVTAYVAAPDDPIIRTWDKVFPGIFVPLDRMPADLRAHVRYPDDLFRTQTALFTTYHMDKPEDFYHREDQWQIPVVKGGDEAVPFMRHIVMRLPDQDSAEFIYMVPFTPRGKDNLAAWMVARSDGPQYGELRVYHFPRQSLVFGPKQIENRINQDTEIARQVSLWDQRGSQVIRGDLLVIPINEALLYVQPLYLQAEGGRIPELKRVVVAFQNQVVMRETLDGALAALFGAGGDAVPAAQVAAATPATGPGAAPAGDVDLRGLAAEARRHYQAAIDAQREGDWARYGEEIKRLGELLERIAASSGR